MFSVRLTGPSGASEDHEFEIDVRSIAVNTPPRIVSSPPRLATVGRLYAYDVQAIDSDTDQLAYELLAGPAGMSIDGTRGTLRWFPQRDQTGSVEVIVHVVDPFAGETTQTFTVTARIVGGPPAITSDPSDGSHRGPDVLVCRRSGRPRTRSFDLSLLIGPVGMTIDTIRAT